MNSLGNCLSNTDCTMNTLLFDAAITGDWSRVEHFMLGSNANALPMTDENQEV
jgi:hypothetical protein